MSAKRRNLQGSQTSLTGQDEMELQGRSRPESASSRKAWLDDHDGPGQDDVDFSPRNQATVDLPSAMAAEPYSMQTKVTRDVRADGKAPPVDCFTRFLKALRSKFSYISSFVFFSFYNKISHNQHKRKRVEKMIYIVNCNLRSFIVFFHSFSNHCLNNSFFFITILFRIEKRK